MSEHPAVPRPALLTLVGVIVVAAVAAVVWPSGSTGHTAAAAGPPVVTISRNACGLGWTGTHTAGPQTIELRNLDQSSAEADLVEVSTGKVYGEVDGMGPDTSETMRVTLGPGRYALRCLIDDVDPLLGPAVRITGPAGAAAAGNPAAVPVTTGDLLDPLKQYQAYVSAGVATLVGQTDALAAVVRAGNLDAARAAWLPAHLTYERLGAAYGAFGDFDGKINGSTAGLSGGLTDPDFTGFHRLEYGLWHGESAASLGGIADELDADVHGLQAAVPGMETEALDLGLRAHEIMENAEQFELTGQTDYGSGTNLATIESNLAGDREVITVLRPLLTPRYPQLSDVDTWSDRLQALLDKEKRPDGSWTPVQQLSTADREKINGATAELIELLAPIATITEPRRVSS